MKNIAWVIVVIVLAVMLMLESRYSLVINSPIVAKIDRMTGDVWIANSGLWIKVKHSVSESVASQGSTEAGKTAAKAKTAEKTK